MIYQKKQKIKNREFLAQLTKVYQKSLIQIKPHTPQQPDYVKMECIKSHSNLTIFPEYDIDRRYEVFNKTKQKTIYSLRTKRKQK